MPRQLRQIEPGKIYHVINRGVEKRKIFSKRQDYSRFTLALEFFNRRDVHTSLWQLIARTGGEEVAPARLIRERDKPRDPLTELLAFTLMPNHYHLILREINPGGIISFMQKLGGYSTYFNKQYDRVGALFQGRYKSIEVADDEHAKRLFVYVHTNTVELVEPKWKDGIVRDPNRAIKKVNTYEWSSYGEYTGDPKYSGAVETKYYKKLFRSPSGCRKVTEGWITDKRRRAGPDPATQWGFTNVE